MIFYYGSCPDIHNTCPGADVRMRFNSYYRLLLNMQTHCHLFNHFNIFSSDAKNQFN